jgi:anti-sigma factor ChrR (cupin superfamily)
MSSPVTKDKCSRTEDVSVYALQALGPAAHAEMEAHLASCVDCQQELAAVAPVVRAFAAYPTDLLRPANSSSLWDEIARRVAPDAGTEPLAAVRSECPQPEWENVAEGIWCKLLATDRTRRRVSMLVRLAPDTEYPPHQHAGVEELHLLEGELWINDRKLYPGDYNRAPPGTADKRVWSETGCTCVLITSTDDVLA